jgi:hypothetical protein
MKEQKVVAASEILKRRYLKKHPWRRFKVWFLVRWSSFYYRWF